MPPPGAAPVMVGQFAVQAGVTAALTKWSHVAAVIASNPAAYQDVFAALQTPQPQYLITACQLAARAAGTPMDAHELYILHRIVQSQPAAVLAMMQMLNVELGGKRAVNVDYTYDAPDTINVTPQGGSPVKLPVG